jgi:Dolichyl-phosphate-mannose-protein mannosyltransferase
MSATLTPPRAAILDVSREPIAFQPLDEADASWSAPWVARATLAFVALGVWLRISRTLLNFPLWGDETLLAANLIDRGYLELTRPLSNRQVCPTLFLWAERAVVDQFGFNELTLRLFPMVCGVLGLLLFKHLATRLTSEVPALVAVALFAVSWWPIRYCAEVKPYASDFLVSVTLLAVAVEWWRRPDRSGWLWGLAVLGPVALGLSYPSVFVAGGVGLALLPTVIRARRASVWAAYSCYLLGLTAAFGCLLSFYAPSAANRSFFLNYWASAFPPLGDPARLASWLFTIHTGYMFAYPEGGERGASSLTAICFVCGAVILWRRGRWTVVAMALMPFLLGLVAAALKCYPYGMSNRTMQYLAPMICLLAGLGAASLIALIRDQGHRQRTLAVILIGLACLGLSRDAYSLHYPYRLATEDRTRAFARWFWIEESRGAELICARSDLGVMFRPVLWENDHATSYLCLQKIYSPRHARGEPRRLETVTQTRPLRVVFFNEVPEPGKNARYDAWLAGITFNYELRGTKTYTVSPIDGRPDETSRASYLVQEYVPKSPDTAVAKSSATNPR